MQLLAATWGNAPEGCSCCFAFLWLTWYKATLRVCLFVKLIHSCCLWRLFKSEKFKPKKSSGKPKITCELTWTPGFRKGQRIKWVGYTPISTGHGHQSRGGWNQVETKQVWNEAGSGGQKQKRYSDLCLLPKKGPEVRVCSTRAYTQIKSHRPHERRPCRLLKFPTLFKLKYYLLLPVFPGSPHQLFQISSFFSSITVNGTLYLSWGTWKWWNWGSEKLGNSLNSHSKTQSQDSKQVVPTPWPVSSLSWG